MGMLMQNGRQIGGTVGTASEQIYDNTSSGLAATTTQAAIDELNTDLTNKTKTTSNSIGTLAINQNQTMTTDCLLVCTVSISANVQYAGYSIKVNNLVVGGYGVISTPSPSLSLYSSYRLNKGDVVYIEQNTGTTVTAKIYSN